MRMWILSVAILVVLLIVWFTVYDLWRQVRNIKHYLRTKTWLED